VTEGSETVVPLGRQTNANMT